MATPPTDIDRDQVRVLLEQGAPVIEVLSSHEYEEEHIAGAMNVPLKTLDRQTTAQLRKDRPVVVYCNDYQ